MLFCRVTLGKSFLQFSAMKMAHAPPGHHSVIGRPSVNGLAYAEYVIYRGEQVIETLNIIIYGFMPSIFIAKNYIANMTAQKSSQWGMKCVNVFHFCFSGLPRISHHLPDNEAGQHASVLHRSRTEVIVNTLCFYTILLAHSLFLTLLLHKGNVNCTIYPRLTHGIPMYELWICTFKNKLLKLFENSCNCEVWCTGSIK